MELKNIETQEKDNGYWAVRLVFNTTAGEWVYAGHHHTPYAESAVRLGIDEAMTKWGTSLKRALRVEVSF